MADHPIIMSADSVRAILAGRKTQSRRVLRLVGAESIEERPDDTGERWPWSPQHDGWVACPYGAVGSRLWVRESFARVWAHADGPSDEDRVEYRADTDAKRPGGWDAERDAPKGARWMSPLFMPRRYSRITLEILSVRVERVQDISEADAIAEGVAHGRECASFYPHTGGMRAMGAGECDCAPAERFADAWDAVNGRRAGCSWADNPHVWCISFRRIDA